MRPSVNNLGEQSLNERDFERRFEELCDIAQLHPRYRTVLGFRYKPGYQYTLQETANAMRISRERVRQIEAKALMRLRTAAQWAYTRSARKATEPKPAAVSQTKG